MSKKVNMNVYLHSLLVINQMNYFTVSEAKDALLREHTEFTDKEEARKFIYRQLSRNIEKGLIKRADIFNNGTKKTVYSKTEKFLESAIVPIKRGAKTRKIAVRKAPVKVVETPSYKTELKKELIAYVIDLKTTIQETKEYKRLADRFPELQERLLEYELQAKYKSIELLGKVHALQNLTGFEVTEH